MFKLRKLVALGVGAAVVYNLDQTKKLLAQRHFYLSETAEKNAEQPVLTLNSAQRRYLPWERNYYSLRPGQNWEMRKVRVQGVLTGNYHLVYRKRNGRSGFMVFKALRTANSNANARDIELGASGKGLSVGMMVNLGWVDEKDVPRLPTAEVDYISKVENDTSLPGIFSQVQDPITGFVYNSEGEDFEFPIEDFTETEVVITGFLRKGERANRWAGIRSYGLGVAPTMIDLTRMASFYNFMNFHSATNYYLEAATEFAPDGEQEKKMIIPANLDKPIEGITATLNKDLYKFYELSEYLAGAMTALTVLVI